MAPGCYHGGIIHRFLVSNTAKTKIYLDSSTAATDLPQRLKSTRPPQIIPITVCNAYGNGFMLFITWGLRKNLNEDPAGHP
jgi:hypothetical protein